jgi:hypothetical protein
MGSTNAFSHCTGSTVRQTPFSTSESAIFGKYACWVNRQVEAGAPYLLPYLINVLLAGLAFSQTILANKLCK